MGFAVATWVLLLVPLALTYAFDQRAMFDFALYWQGARDLLDGVSPYGPRPLGVRPELTFVYPPIFAMFIVPFAAMPLTTAKVVWQMLSVGAVGVGCLLSSSTLLAGGQPLPWRRPVVFAALGALAFLFYPVRANLWFGQVDGLIFALTVGALALQTRGRPFSGGVLLGTATAFKLFPLPLVAYALWVGWRRLGFAALVTFAVLQLLSAIPQPALLGEYWLKELFTAPGINAFHNLALPAVASRFAPPAPSILIPIATIFAVATVGAAFLLGRLEGSSQALPGAALLLAAIMIQGPIVENHHMVWLLWPLWILLTAFVQQRSKVRLGLLAITSLLFAPTLSIVNALVARYPDAPIVEAARRADPISPAAILSDTLLEVGVVLLYVLLIATLIQRIQAHRSARQPAQGAPRPRLAHRG